MFVHVSLAHGRLMQITATFVDVQPAGTASRNAAIAQVGGGPPALRCCKPASTFGGRFRRKRRRAAFLQLGSLLFQLAQDAAGPPVAVGTVATLPQPGMLLSTQGAVAVRHCNAIC